MPKVGVKSELQFIEGAQHGGREFVSPQTIARAGAFLATLSAAEE